MTLIGRFLPDAASKSAEKRERRTRLYSSEQAHSSSRSQSSKAQAFSSSSGERRLTRIDSRRVIGLVLVLAAVVGGYFSSVKADQRIYVASAAHPLAPGQPIGANDVELVKAAVPSGLYATTADQLIGRASSVSIDSGELIALSQIGKSSQGNLVTVPVRAINLPTLGRGDRVSLWATQGVVASDLAVEEVVRESTSRVVTLRVPDSLTALVIAALANDVYLVKLP